MRFRKDQKGFTFIELVIVIAIVGIMASLSLTMLNRIKYSNTEKMVTYVSDELKKLQIVAMSKEQHRYLHIYKEGNEYYMITSNSPTYNALTMGTKGFSLGSNITIYKVIGASGAETEITGATRIVISYKKDGKMRKKDSADNDMEDIRKIVIVGSYTAEIRLNPETGKSVVVK